MNAYEMLAELRSNVNEATANHWTDIELVRKLNAAQRFTAAPIAASSGDWLVTSGVFTPTASVISLPYYVAKPIHMIHKANGYEIPINLNVRDHQLTKLPELSLYAGGMPNAYLVGDTIVINQSGFTDEVTLFYERRIPELLTGQADTGSGASTLKFPVAIYPKLIDDYYNGVYVEIYTAAGYIRSAISDYVFSTRTATITGTPVAADYFGTESVLPREADQLIVLKATLNALAKPSSAIDPKYYEMFKDEFVESWNEFKSWIADRIPAGGHVRITEVE